MNKRGNGMPGKINYKQNNSSFPKIFDKGLQLEDIPFKTMKVTIYALRWIFLLIFLFIIVGIIILFITGGQSYLQIILGYSITGFFTFFMGYFGWLLAQSIIEMITGKEPKEERTYSYYFTKKNRYKF
jgi:hypothetical protein